MASRRSAVPSFKVMDVMARALAMEQTGRRVLHLEVGQPQAPAPRAALSAAREALASDRLGYTHALGREPLRDGIARLYEDRYGVRLDPKRVHVTTGSSAAFTLAFLAAFDVGDAVAVPETTYPCYRNVLQAVGCEVVPVPVNAHATLGAEDLSAAVAARAAQGLAPLKGLVLSSPANPTGAMLDRASLAALCAACARHEVRFISDEIYHGLSYGGMAGMEATAACPAVAGGGAPVVVSSFSKFHCMTGWRVGWLVAPTDLEDGLHRLQQNLYICAPAVAQAAALGALRPEAQEELSAHVERYARNRRVVLDGLAAMGIPDARVAPADGAFYAYADLAGAAEDLLGHDPAQVDAEALCQGLLEAEGVAVTPGTDFEDPGTGRGRRCLRISYAGSTADMEEAMGRMLRWWRGGAAMGG